ncbi:hypothetical protein, partial [Acidovorax sp. Root217]|uniref:hypothetical protein n=2 Tax=Acidovorax TaxID=12916 RepID=UPI001F3E270B
MFNALALSGTSKLSTAGTLWIVSDTGTVSLRLSGFSLNTAGVQFNPSMSRTRKATHRTRFSSFICFAAVPVFLRRFYLQG